MTGRWFYPGPPVSSTNKNDRHDITDILLKVALNTIKHTSKPKIGKAPGIDDIPNEFLKYGGDIMIKSLSDLFTCISDFEMIPDD